LTVHELAVCQGLLDQVATIARDNAASAVRRIVIRIGPLSGVEPELLSQAFPLARAGTVARDAELVIERLPLKVACETCGAESEARPNRLVCAHCGDWRTKLVSGDEMLLASVELSTETDEPCAIPAAAT
jgi:hydrogenase nickel incorporation protein HypA/HybF